MTDKILTIESVVQKVFLVLWMLHIAVTICKKLKRNLYLKRALIAAECLVVITILGCKLIRFML